MNEIYNSARKLFPVQALSGYGKTALFQLPLLAMKRRCQNKRVVSFVLVPYVTLMGDMFQRLNKCGLNVQYATNVSRMNENDITADVYVACFESARDDHLMELFSNWPYRFRNVHLGYLVVDEFHNVGYQDYRPEVTQGFRHLDVSNFAKVVMLSGTIGKGRFGLHLKAMGITAEPTEQVKDSDKVRVFNAVMEIPLRNVVKTVQKMDTVAMAMQKTVTVVRRFLELVDKQKVIIVTSTVPAVLALGRLTYDGEEPVWVHGKLSSQEKISRFSEFCENPKKRVLIGTKLISEGVDVANLGAIVMCDYVPSITGMIQAAGRLRKGGNCFIFWTRSTDFMDNFPRYDPDKGINGQMAAYYGCSGSTEDHPMPFYERRRDTLLSSSPITQDVVTDEELELGGDSLIAYCESLGVDAEKSDDTPNVGSILPKMVTMSTGVSAESPIIPTPVSMNHSSSTVAASNEVATPTPANRLVGATVTGAEEREPHPVLQGTSDDDADVSLDATVSAMSTQEIEVATNVASTVANPLDVTPVSAPPSASPASPASAATPVVVTPVSAPPSASPAAPASATTPVVVTPVSAPPAAPASAPTPVVVTPVSAPPSASPAAPASAATPVVVTPVSTAVSAPPATPASAVHTPVVASVPSQVGVIAPVTAVVPAPTAAIPAPTTVLPILPVSTPVAVSTSTSGSSNSCAISNNNFARVDVNALLRDVARGSSKRSSSEMAQNEGTSKRPNTRLDANDIKEKIKAFLGTSMTIFEALGIAKQARSSVILDGVNSSAVPDYWLPNTSKCTDCLSPNNECYNPFVASGGGLRQFMLEGIMVLKYLVSEAEFSRIVANSAEIGPHTVLLELATRRDHYSRQLKKKKKLYLDFMNKFSFTSSNLVFETDISEMERLYNGMWTEIMENKYDVLAYCSSSDNTFK
ncbi:Y' element ATP-dependent helicase [Maudiozyma humilis]|uniref:ATP-dependent RNA helicase n=1 Tax=Maudiozyma humilis TaxID=51915 RepID=A0AAV5S2X4_MAUHU|nr:Y' element ATP-dependent helicase [Kazachstania humilis]